MQEKNEKGIVIVGVLAAMVFLGLFTSVAASMQTNNTVQVDKAIHTVRAKAASQGVESWYMRQLNNDADWSDEATQNITLGDIDVTITVNSASGTEVDFTVSSNVSPAEGVLDVTRNVNTVAEKGSPIFNNFALFQAYMGGRLRLRTNVQDSVVHGNVYSAGGGDVDLNNIQDQGVFYIANGTTFTASGTKTGKTLAAGVGPTFPIIDGTNYNAVMTGYDAQLATLAGTVNVTVNNTDFVVEEANPKCVLDVVYGVVCDATVFQTRGANVTITGNGTIRCNTNCLLHTRISEIDGSNLTITPDDDGHISFLAKRNVTMGHANGFTNININSAATAATRTVNFYSQAWDNTGRLINVLGNDTTINNAANANTQVNFYSHRRIIFNDGAQSYGRNNLYYIDNAAAYAPLNSSTNNVINVIGDSSAGVGRPTIMSGLAIANECTGTQDCFRMNSGYSGGHYAQFFGLIYQYDSLGIGRCDLDDALITGAAICQRHTVDQIRRTTITFDPDYLPDKIVDGFDTYTSRKRNSQNGI